MAAFNGIRVLPDMPKNIPNMEILIQEFETGLKSPSRQDTVSESSTLSGGSFVKKIVEAYESSVRASIENAEQEQSSKRSGLFNTIRNQKNVEKSGAGPSICSELSNCNSLKNTFEISPVSSVVQKHDLEDDFTTYNRCHSKSDKKIDILKTCSKISSKINKSGFMRELTNIRPSFSKKSETETLKRRGQIFYNSPESERKSKNNISLICSSPLEDVDDKDTDYDESPLNDILTNSHDSSNASNNSYKNLQADLYDFESKRWQFELSSTSSQSLNSSSRSLRDDTSSTKSHTNDSLLLDSSFQDITVTNVSSEDISNNCENPQDAEQILELSDRESPRVIGVSLKRPIKIDNDMSVTWIPVLDEVQLEKLPQKKSLKKLLSIFNRAKLSLNHKKIDKKSKKKQLKKQHPFDSGFIERCPSVSSSSSQQSSHSDAGHVDDEPSMPPTFGTFGHPKYIDEHCTEKTIKNHMMLTEIFHTPKLASVPFDSNPWISSRSLASLDKENQDVEPMSRNTSIASFSKSRVFCRYSSLPKHPHLIRSSIPKHPSVAQTKMDQIEEEKATVEKMMQRNEKIEQKSDVLQLRYSSTLPIPIPQSTLNFSSRMTKCADSSTNYDSNYDIPNSHKSSSTLDEIVLRRQASAYDVPRRSWLSSLTMNPSSPVYGDNLYEEIVPCMPRFATVSPKNFRFFISQEKSRAIEKCFDN